MAPSYRRARKSFRRVFLNDALHAKLKSDMQRLRGGIYLQDGAISASDLSADGRHILPTDAASWHLLLMDGDGSVAGCARYLEHSEHLEFDQLSVRHSALTCSPEWGAPARFAIEKELATARHLGFSYVELGGWAIAEHVRGTAECLRSALATYAWSRLIGGALGISTATERNGSASILKRLGGRLLEWGGKTIPSYFDPRYGCQMQMLRFDSRAPNPRYEAAIAEMIESLETVPVVCSDALVVRTAEEQFRSVPLLPSTSRPTVSAAV